MQNCKKQTPCAIFANKVKAIKIFFPLSFLSSNLPHHMPNNVAFVFQHDDVHSRGCRHDENILDPPAAPCTHSRQNSRDASISGRPNVVQTPQCHRQLLALCTEIDKKKSMSYFLFY